MEPFISFPLRLRNRHFLAADLLILMAIPSIALALRTDGIDAVDKYYRSLLVITAVFPILKIGVFYLGNLYSRFWRYASIDELAHITALCALATLLQTLVFFLALRPTGLVESAFPRSIPLIDGLLTLIAIGGVRFSVRFTERLLHKRGGSANGKPVLIAGAGEAGVMIVQEMLRNPALGLKPVGFVDDAPDKQGMRIRGLPVLGRCADIPEVCGKTGVQEVIIAMPTASGKIIRKIVGICEQAGVHTKTIPGMYELLGGKVSIGQLREVEIEDLLRREPVNTDVTAVGELIRGKRVLITGGGGSIGSELCRQVLQFEPKCLVILGHGENSVFQVQNELNRLVERGLIAAGTNGRRKPVTTQIHSVIADIRFPERMSAVFAEYKPEIVFHSAAHKHVHLMESNAAEAITNNVLGTRNLLDAALAVGTEHFVMISTDKAVNPTGIMGASKRVAELLVHQAARQSGKPYVAVRFGNVLGSRGSVVMTFKEQIANGGPLTITHPDMARYFMTIPEAVQLVLQAAALGTGGEVFMLDMGEPIKIVDLARDIIELSGLQEGQDIDIAFTGVRPGEKLYEEMFIAGEKYERTRHEKVFIVANASSLVPQQLESKIAMLEMLAARNDRAEIVGCLQNLVPEYQPTISIEGVDSTGDQLPTGALHSSTTSASDSGRSSAAPGGQISTASSLRHSHTVATTSVHHGG